MLNGPGLRVVLWVAGCSHNCKGCHNPITWDANGGIPFDPDAMNEILVELAKDHISGLTLSGGDPLFHGNRAMVEVIVSVVKNKFPSKNIWLYTGFSWDDIKGLDIIKNIDVVVDGKYIEQSRDTQLHWRGSSNQRVIDVKKTLESKQITLFPNT